MPVTCSVAEYQVFALCDWKCKKRQLNVWHCLEFVSNSYLKVLLAALAQHYFSLFFDWNLHNESANFAKG